MRCLVCGKQIGPLRRLRDRRFCCEEHRRAARRSARVLRDLGEEDDFDGPWLVTPPPPEKPAPAPQVTAAIGIGLLACLVALLLVVPARPPRAPSSLAERLDRLLPAAPSVSLAEDFRTGLNAWTDGPAEGPGWLIRDGKLHPRQLRLWRPTVGLRDYELSFDAEIERRAVAWAFRAADTANYYAVKVIVGEARTGRGAAIVRYTVAGGKKLEPFTAPLPLPLRAHTPYRISLRVKSDQFVTLIEEQVIDAWRDSRHPKGGVGFFCDPGEEAAVSQVRLTARAALSERLRIFSLILAPGA
jgi:hypothetical protein